MSLQTALNGRSRAINGGGWEEVRFGCSDYHSRRPKMDGPER